MILWGILRYIIIGNKFKILTELWEFTNLNQGIDRDILIPARSCTNIHHSSIDVTMDGDGAFCWDVGRIP